MFPSDSLLIPASCCLKATGGLSNYPQCPALLGIQAEQEVY